MRKQESFGPPACREQANTARSTTGFIAGIPAQKAPKISNIYAAGLLPSIPSLSAACSWAGAPCDATIGSPLAPTFGVGHVVGPPSGRLQAWSVRCRCHCWPAGDHVHDQLSVSLHLYYIFKCSIYLCVVLCVNKVKCDKRTQQ